MRFADPGLWGGGDDDRDLVLVEAQGSHERQDVR